MRKYFLISILFLSSCIVAQNSNKVSQSVIDFWNIIKNNENIFEMDHPLVNKFNTDEKKNIAKLYYRAIANDPLGFNKFNLIKFREWKKRRKAGSLTLHDIKPGMKIKRLKEVISSYYGETFTKVISIPYYLNVKIISRKDSVYVSNNKFNFPWIILKVEVQEIIKGSGMFKKSEIIEVNILSNWMTGKHEFFKIGSNYFMPIKFWNFKNYVKKKYALAFISINDDSIYPIDKNNVIRNICDFFFNKTNMNWDEFKQKFVKNYINF